MVDRTQRRVSDLLQRMQTDGLSAAKELFCTALNYHHADQLLSYRGWPDRAKETLDGPPTIIALHTSQFGDFEIIHVALSSEYRGRTFPLSLTAERLVVNQLLKDHPYALFLFSDAEQEHWHLVNVRYDEGTERRRVFRRIAVGPHERLRTASERIAMLDVAALEEDLFGIPPLAIQQRHDEAFDVDQVTDEFFRQYQRVFNSLQDDLCSQTEDRVWAHDFALQLLNRVMFLYYVQRKRWLGGDTDFLCHFWRAYGKADRPEDTFVGEWLNVLFFEAFNNRFEARHSDRQHFPDEILDALTMAPFLNGGLFRRNDLDRAYSPRITDRRFEEIFDFLEGYNFTISEDTPLDQEVAVDPEMIGKVYESLVNVSGETDERGEAGIFYTPRVEIDLMCRLSLVDWLTNHLGEEKKRLVYEMVFAFDPEDKRRADAALADHDLWPRVDELLRTVAIVDPACGSGSFLVGMLYVLDDLLARADSQLGRQETPYERKKRIIANSLYGVDVMEWAVDVAELRLWLQLVIDTELEPAELKFRPLLPNLSFKLRCGDSLVQEIGGINFALRKGSGLIPTPLKGRIRRLKGEKRKFYNNDPRREYSSERELRRAELQLFRDLLDGRIKAIGERLREIEDGLRPQENLFGEVQSTQMGLDRVSLEREKARLEEERGRVARARDALQTVKDVPFVWDIAFVEVFEGERRGFDIVVGNPPYVRRESIRDPQQASDEATTADKRAYRAKLARSVYTAWPRTFGYNWAKDRPGWELDAQSNLYIYFYLHGLSLLNDKGAFCFITSNSWLDAGYGKDLQEFLLTRGEVKVVLDNQLRRSFASADVNTVIVALGAPRDSGTPRSESLAHTARFIMLTVPYEEVLSPVIWEEVEEATARCTAPEYRVFPLKQAALLETGMDTTATRFLGDKWGAKYLRAPDIFFVVMSKGKHMRRPMSNYFEGERYLNTGGADGFFMPTRVTQHKRGLCHVFNDRTTDPGNAPFEGLIEDRYLVPIVKDYTKKDKRIEIHGYDAYCLVIEDEPSARLREYIQWGEGQGYHQRSGTRTRRPWYKPTRQMTGAAEVLVPRSFNDTFVIHYNPRGYLSLRFYRLHVNKGEVQQLAAFLNSTLMALFLETLGNKSLGQGVLDFYMTDFLSLEIPVVEDPELEPVFRRISNRPIGDIWAEAGVDRLSDGLTTPKPPADRHTLDSIIFDALGLTQGEREGVYEAVVGLVEARLSKAQSV